MKKKSTLETALVLIGFLLLSNFGFSQSQIFPERAPVKNIESLYPARIKRQLTTQDYPFDQSSFFNEIRDRNKNKGILKGTSGLTDTGLTLQELSLLSPQEFVQTIIDNADYDHYYIPLFSYNGTYSSLIHSNENIQEVFKKIKEIGATYDGDISSGLKSLVTYIHQSNFHAFYHDDINYDNTTKALYKEAVDVLIANPKLITLNEEALNVMYEFGSIIDEDGIRARPTVMNFIKELIKDMLIRDTWKGIPSSLERSWARAYNQIFFLMTRGSKPYKDAVEADPEFVDLLAGLALDDELRNKENYDFMVGNAIGELVKIAQISSIAEKACDNLNLVTQKYERLHPRWIKAVNGINKYGDCNKYNLCISSDEVNEELKAKLFPNKYIFDDGKLVINTPVDATKIDGLYHALKQVKAQFYRMQQTDEPLSSDPNHTLQVYLFGSPKEYRDYAWTLFWIATNNGGMYIEQIGTFYTFDRTGGLTLESLFRHEYVHYLQGRNWVPGFWGEVPFYHNERNTTLEEGSADFFAGSTATEGIKMLEQNIWTPSNEAPNWPTLKTMLKHEYQNSTNYQYCYGDMIWYNWYLNDFKKIKQIINLLNASDVDGFDELMNSLSNNPTEEAKWRAHLGAVADGTIKGWDPTTDWVDDAFINAQDIDDVKNEYIAATGDDAVSITLAASTGNRRFHLQGTLTGTTDVSTNEEAALSIDKAMDDLLIYLGKNANINNFAYSVGYYKNISISNNKANATFIIDGPLRDSEVGDDPKCDFYSDITTVVAGHAVKFKDLTSGYPTAYSWSFQGGTPASSTDKNPAIVYNTPGQYDVTLTSSNGSLSDKATKTKYINVIEDTWTDCIYLSDINWESASSGWLEVHKDKSIEDNTLRLDGKKYEKGLGTHASSSIVYKLEGKYTRFLSDIGVDDEKNYEDPTITFEVWLDGTKIYTSPILKTDSPITTIDLDITGGNELKLIVTDGGDGINSDHADWADARLIPVDPSTSLSEEMNASQQGLEKVIIYPNPTQGACKIDLGSHQAVALRLMDASGRVVMTKQYKNQKIINLNLSSYTQGVYYIQLTSKNNSIVKPIIHTK
ncbi:T9SS C-terminal target domain-containing protein [Marinilabiliaceae bacterium JC017]|nr:T9SS C-terminal target domain-containing protein [Marinilabiliaceae bacterium JC017]